MSRLHSRGESSVSRSCALLGYSKQAYYKRQKHEEKRLLEEELLLREVVNIRRDLPVLGGRKLLHSLQNRFSKELLPGRDAFFNLLRANGLLIRKRKCTRPITTMSWHHFHKYSNLWKGYIPEHPNEVWVADITYLRMHSGRFLYLSLLTDVYSRKIVGWHLSESLELNGPLAALKMALKKLPEGHTLMHHSDRGVQYCSKTYIELLQKKGIQISMTENGDPKENAIAERVNGILKEEWLNREVLLSPEQAKEKVASVITLYNRKRPHLSNNYLTPEEAHGSTGILKRRWKTYYKRKEDIRIYGEILPIFANGKKNSVTE